MIIFHSGAEREFNTVLKWVHDQWGERHYIAPRKSMSNGYAKSVNG